MMAGNPNWWSMNNSMLPQHHQLFVYGSTNVITSSADSSSSSSAENHSPCPDIPLRSLSQLSLLGSEEEDRYGASLFQQQKKLENWEDQVLNLNPYNNSLTRSLVDDDDDGGGGGGGAKHVLYGQNHDVLIHQNSSSTTVRSCNNNNNTSWISSPTSCVTTLNNKFFNFSGEKRVSKCQNQHDQGHSSEACQNGKMKCNSTSNGGVSKKARVQQSSAQTAMKVRKEKLGDRITAIHQLVSPFGKTDTASVLSEAIGYIRFLHGQIEAMSAPYMRSASACTSHHLLHSHELGRESVVIKELMSRGLCVVPISYTQKVCNNDSGADYWASPAAFGGGF